MSSAHSMNARKCVHAQKPYPSQAFAHESSKVGGRGKREEERQERQRPGGWWKERQPNKTKHIGGTKKAYLGTDRLTKQGEERSTTQQFGTGLWNNKLHLSYKVTIDSANDTNDREWNSSGFHLLAKKFYHSRYNSSRINKNTYPS